MTTTTTELLEPETAAALILSAPLALEWRVAPEDTEQWHLWLDCERKWLASLERRSGAKNTARCYHRDVTDFFAAFAASRLMPWCVTPAHAEIWAEHLAAQNLATTTINRKIAALSSLYRYAAADYILPGQTPLWPHPNPFANRALRTKITPYGHAAYPTTAQIEALLAQINVATITGLRNMAIILGLFATTRRVSEWLHLRWHDIHTAADGSRYFTYRYKGGSTKRQTIPPAVWTTIQTYLQATNRWPPANDTDYIFIATTAAAKHFTNNGRPQLPADYNPANQPLSANYINRLLKTYGAAAGIPANRLHAHALRHAGARWRKDRGANVYQLRDILGHSSIAVTQIYTETVLDEPEDPFANTIADILPRQLKLLLKT